MANKAEDFFENSGRATEQSRTRTRTRIPAATRTDTINQAQGLVTGVDPQAPTRVAPRPELSAGQRTANTLQTFGAPTAQGSRGAAESAANKQIAESLRLNLLRQERLNKGNGGFGGLGAKLDPIQFRALQSARAGNREAVGQGIAGVNAIRTADVDSRGDQLTAATGLVDRELGESGANFRAQLELDGLTTRGQFGLAESLLGNSIAADGTLAQQQEVTRAGQIADPLTAERIRLMREQELALGAEGISPGQAVRGRAALLDSAASGAATAPGFEPSSVMVQIPGSETKIPMSPELARAYAATQDPNMKRLFESQALIEAEGGAYARQTGQGAPAQPDTAVSDARGTTGSFGPAQTIQPPPRAGGVGGEAPGLGSAGLTPPGTGRAPAPRRDLSGRDAQAAINVVASLQPGQALPLTISGGQEDIFIEQNKDYIGIQPPEVQRRLLARFGAKVAPFLSPELAEGQ